MNDRPNVVALIVAAGHGARAGEGLPKQYRKLAGTPVVRRSINAFVDHPHVDVVQVVIGAEHGTLYEEVTKGLALPSPTAGGDTRQESVLRGLEGLTTIRPAIVLIHDAARPLVSADVITATIGALETHDGALPVLAASDTLKRLRDGEVEETVPRENLGSAQTPQAFRFDKILAAHRAARDTSVTDDAAIAERAGMKIAAVPGSRLNMKLTTPEDFVIAEALLANVGTLRTGQGFDVHRFGPGDHVWLCGLKVEHTNGLVGHSDADVGLHALTDALLGAACLGDIGQHFPPSDERWRGAASHLFLTHAFHLIAERGGRIEHVDVTLICERPKVAPHREAMIARIAELLALDRTRVSVKATTTEGLGFTGRSEGIAAQAIATVRLP